MTTQNQHRVNAAAPDTNRTRDHYQALMDGRVKRGLWGKDSRFDPSKIAANPSVRQFFIDVVRPYLEPGCQALDVGCGPGGFLAATAPHCGEIVGLDIAPNFVEQCQAVIDARGLGNAHALLYDGYHIPFDDERFDVVILVDVIHHFDRVGAMMREVRRVVRRGGRLIVFEPNKLNPLLFLMCVLDKNEWGVLPLGSKGAYRNLLADDFDIDVIDYNGLLVGPDSPLALATADWLASAATGRPFRWACPKIFIAARRR